MFGDLVRLSACLLLRQRPELCQSRSSVQRADKLIPECTEDIFNNVIFVYSKIISMVLVFHGKHLAPQLEAQL